MLFWFRGGAGGVFCGGPGDTMLSDPPGDQAEQRNEALLHDEALDFSDHERILLSLVLGEEADDGVGSLRGVRPKLNRWPRRRFLRYQSPFRGYSALLVRFGYPLAKCITGITLICVRVPAWSAELDIREQLGPAPLE